MCHEDRMNSEFIWLDFESVCTFLIKEHLEMVIRSGEVDVYQVV